MSYYQVLAHEANTPAAEPPAKVKRARHPKGTDKGGEFVADDPGTPDVDEAFEAV